MPSLLTGTARDSALASRRLRRAVALASSASIALLAVGMFAPASGGEARAEPGRDRPMAALKRKLARELPILGHRNWIVVADLAYPAQSNAAIETIYVGGDHVKTVEAVLQAVDAAKHVRGVIYVDAEAQYVPEDEAPGMTAYRKKLAGLLKKRPVKTMLHEKMIANLDEAAKTFRILILKTDMVIPYTTVFIQLDCGYWGAEQEKRLREAMEAKAK